MTKEAGAVVGRERTESGDQGGLEIIESPGRRLAQMRFELGEGQSVTSGKAGGLEEREPLKAVCLLA